MNVEYFARTYHLDDQIRGFAERKLAKLEKFVSEPVEVKVTLELEKHRHIAELHLAHRFGVLQATVETGDMYDSINLAVDKMEKQARRASKKYKDKRRRADRQNGQAWPLEVIAGESVESGEPRILRSSRLSIKPMSIEEAALRLQTSKNEFVVFRDSGTDRVSVLYRRKDRNYGLISPEF